MNAKIIIAQTLHLPLDHITDDLGPGDVAEWDSLHHLMIFTALENAFHIQFDHSELVDIENVADIVALVEEKTKP